MTSTDNLALLLPEASRADQDRARKVVTLLRLTVDDGRSARAASTRLTLERARSEFESHTRRRVRAR